MYLFFTILFIITKSPFESTLLQNYSKSDFFIAERLSQIMMNIFYLRFFLKFLNIDMLIPRFFNFMRESTGVISILSIFLFLFCAFFRFPRLFENYFLFVFYPVFICIAGAIIFKTLFLKGKLKHFILIGFFAFLAFSAYTLYLSYDLSNFNSTIHPFDSFLMGVLLENIAFATGLGYKIKLLNNQKIEAQHRIISHQSKDKEIRKKYQQEIEEKLKRQEKELYAVHSKAKKEELQKVSALFKEKLMQLQLDGLRNQMDPHFVFNALNSIKAYLVINDRKQAIHFLNKFSKLIRKTLEVLREDQVSLKDELEIIDLYISVENLRFDSTIQYSLQVENELDLAKILIPPLILQPFVENALIHGLLPSDGPRNLNIIIYTKEEDIYLEIQDNGIGRKKTEPSETPLNVRKSFGLKIIQERLSFYNLKHQTLITYNIFDLFENDLPNGTKVVFKISKTQLSTVPLLN